MLRHFAALVRMVSVKSVAPGLRVDGDWVHGTPTTVETSMICIPITPAQLKHLPEGKYRAGDMRCYHKGAPRFADGDVITVKNVQYAIGDITDRELDGNYTMYLAKRDYDQS
jgi:hypothetical protein